MFVIPSSICLYLPPLFCHRGHKQQGKRKGRMRDFSLFVSITGRGPGEVRGRIKRITPSMPNLWFHRGINQWDRKTDSPSSIYLQQWIPGAKECIFPTSLPNLFFVKIEPLFYETEKRKWGSHLQYFVTNLSFCWILDS